MADAKRQSVGNRVATPKLGNQGPGELDAALTKAVGARVKLTTTSPSATLEGILYAACPVTNLLAINTANLSAAAASNPLSSPPGDYHILSVSRIQTFSILSLVESSTAPSSSFDSAASAVPGGLSVARLDLKALKAREEAAIQKVREKDATKGKGVTKEAQEIFDAIARTLPVRWHDTTIVVNESVMIKQPYDLDSCIAPKDQQNSLNRVKKVLENERRKIAERNSSANVASSNGGGALTASAKTGTAIPSSKVAVATPLANSTNARKGG